MTWDRMKRLAKIWIPKARLCHPYPEQRLVVNPDVADRSRSERP